MTKNRIELILFDVDNTLLYHTKMNYYVIIAKLSNSEISHVKLFCDKLLDKLDSGELSVKEFESRIAKKFLLDINRISWRAFYLNEMKPWKNILGYVNQLNRSYKTAILTNVDAQRYKNTKRLLSRVKFNYMFPSCQFGIVKPNPKIFNMVFKKTRIKPNRILFVDDNKKNIEVAKKLGVYVIIANKPALTIKNIRKFLSDE